VPRSALSRRSRVWRPRRAVCRGMLMERAVRCCASTTCVQNWKHRFFFMDKTCTCASVLRLRAFFFSYFFCVFLVRGEVSFKRPTSMLHYLYFFSDILVVSYVLSDT